MQHFDKQESTTGLMHNHLSTVQQLIFEAICSLMLATARMRPSSDSSHSDLTSRSALAQVFICDLIICTSKTLYSPLQLALVRILEKVCSTQSKHTCSAPALPPPQEQQRCHILLPLTLYAHTHDHCFMCKAAHLRLLSLEAAARCPSAQIPGTKGREVAFEGGTHAVRQQGLPVSAGSGRGSGRKSRSDRLVGRITTCTVPFWRSITGDLRWINWLEIYIPCSDSTFLLTAYTLRILCNGKGKVAVCRNLQWAHAHVNTADCVYRYCEAAL